MPTTSLAAWSAAKPNGRPTMRAHPQPHRLPSIADPSVQAADAWLRRFQAAVITIMAAVTLGVGAVAFFTSFEAIRAYATTSGGITPAHAWAIPLLVDSFIVIATGAELWLGVHPARRAWWELAWPRALLAAAAVSFVLNVAHAKAGDWPARGVAAIPPAALVLSVELLVMIARRAAIARTHRLTTASRSSAAEATVVVRNGYPTTSMVAPAGDQPPPNSPAKATSGTANSGATYQRVRDLYLGGMTVAAEIARELGVSPSYAQRTLRRVKADLARQQQAAATAPGRAATPERTTEATSDHQHPDDRQPPTVERSSDQPTTPDHDVRQATSRAEATRDGDGRTTTSRDRHLALVAPNRDPDHGKAERGIPVLPLHGKLPCIPAAHSPGDPLYQQCKGQCGQQGHGVHDATCDPDQVRGWWRRWSHANIGLRTGVVFDVIDVDGTQGRRSLQRFLTEHAGAVPIGGPRVRTGSGAGWHLYVAPTGLPDHIGVLEGVDYRAADRYVVAPPSRHSATGRPYVWYSGRGLDTRLGEVPPALRERLTPHPAERQQAPAPTRPAEPGHPYGRAVLAAETARIADARRPGQGRGGERNQVLREAARNLYNLVAGGVLDEATVAGGRDRPRSESSHHPPFHPDRDPDRARER